MHVRAAQFERLPGSVDNATASGGHLWTSLVKANVTLVMTNYRLRGAMLNVEMTPAALAALVEVDVKSVHRWLTEGRVPYPVTRHKVAHALDQQETFLWPELLDSDEMRVAAAADIERVWPTRGAVSSETWHALFSRASGEIDILVYAGAFLIETLDLDDVLHWKASTGTQMRILVGDPDSAAVQMRAAELALPWLPDRCRSTLRYLARVTKFPNLAVRPNQAIHYVSLFRFDGTLLVNAHAYGAWACRSPVLQLRRASNEQLFGFYLQSFEQAWETATPAPSFDC